MRNILAVLFFAITVNATDKLYSLEHSYFQDKFNGRGNVIISLSEENKLKLKFGEKAFEESVSDSLLSAILNNDPYKVKIKLPGSDNYLLANVGTCDLASANFQQNLHFHLTKDGEIVSFSVEPFRSSVERSEIKYSCSSINSRKLVADNVKTKKTVTFRNKASVSLPKEGFTAPIGVFVKPTAEQLSSGDNELFKSAKDKESAGEEVEDQGFLRKYWYVFLPMMIMSFFGPSAPPEQQQTAGATTGKSKKK